MWFFWAFVCKWRESFKRNYIYIYIYKYINTKPARRHFESDFTKHTHTHIYTQLRTHPHITPNKIRRKEQKKNAKQTNFRNILKWNIQIKATFNPNSTHFVYNACRNIEICITKWLRKLRHTHARKHTRWCEVYGKKVSRNCVSNRCVCMYARVCVDSLIQVFSQNKCTYVSLYIHVGSSLWRTKFAWIAKQTPFVDVNSTHSLHTVTR